MNKNKPCTVGKRHSWTFVKNVILKRGWPGHWQISQRGMYRCECGEKKYGEADLNMRTGTHPMDRAPRHSA